MVPVMHHHIPRPSARLPLPCWYNCSAANVWLQWVSKSKHARTALVLQGKEGELHHQHTLPAPMFHFPFRFLPSCVSSLTAVRDSSGTTGTRFAGGHERWKIAVCALGSLPSSWGEGLCPIRCVHKPFPGDQRLTIGPSSLDGGRTGRGVSREGVSCAFLKVTNRRQFGWTFSTFRNPNISRYCEGGGRASSKFDHTATHFLRPH